MKIVLLISLLFTFLIGNSQNQSLKITFISKTPDDSFNYSVFTKVSDKMKFFDSKFDQDTIYYAQPGYDAFYNYVDRLHMGFLTSAVSIQNNNRFIEIAYLQNGNIDSTIYIEFDSSNEKLFEFINLINLQIPTAITSYRLLEKLNNETIYKAFNKWNSDINKCHFFNIGIEIQEKKHKKYAVFEIYSDYSGSFGIVDPIGSNRRMNCYKYSYPDSIFPERGGIPQLCPNYVLEINLLDSLITYTGHDFIMEKIPDSKKGKITIYCYEFGGLKYKKYIPLSEKDNFFKFIFLLQSINKIDDEDACYETINDFFYSKKEYDEWKMKNKKP